ncbi:MAG: PAS domain S-box protein [Deltaproteobacteria bacterium]|nr:PAS domain S-box protein [Deltaproteobacteria bacterium]
MLHTPAHHSPPFPKGGAALLKAKLLAMMVFRVVIALAFLGMTSWFQIKVEDFSYQTLYPLYAVVIAICLLTILYSYAVGRVKNLVLFSYIQITVDIMLITAIVYVTGGFESYLFLLYPVSIIGSAILLSKRGSFFTASISSIAYGALIGADFYGTLPLKYKVFWVPANPSWEEILTTISTNILAFFVVAYLGGHLAEKSVKAEQELKEKGVDFEKLESLNRQIVENISSGIMTLDSVMKITSFNTAAESITGYTLREVYLKDVNGIFHGLMSGDKPLTLTLSPEGRGKGEGGMRADMRFKRKDERELFLGLTVSGGPGADMSWIVIFQDLTQLKAMEEQIRRIEKLKALGELSVGIAHEIRNPLASISGSIQVLKGGLRLGGEDGRLMEIVINETERLNALITDFLLFAKPAQEKRERFNLGELLSGTAEMFRNSPEAKGLGISANVDGGIYIDGDRRQISQVFWNLLLNSAQAASGNGIVEVSLSLMHSRDALPGLKPMAEIKVKDNGIGIAPEDIGRIFDPFWTTKERGTGLGLAIAHRIVESHSGTIEVQSAAGRGSVFTVSLPAAVSVLPG